MSRLRNERGTVFLYACIVLFLTSASLLFFVQELEQKRGLETIRASSDEAGALLHAGMKYAVLQAEEADTSFTVTRSPENGSLVIDADRISEAGWSVTLTVQKPSYTRKVTFHYNRESGEITNWEERM
ncbi:hypothetical protein C6I21_01825 [Alkalicoccus urumqiensis]|uniref:Competence protein ComG n=1 Tax=Alkalicoccus urumqiensis TaxID=1548213 RepID=A0A2P6MK97_ALKUR|nr:hypothetical protein C6I21_01825 [Alkalicoccus urumqiensis]